MTHDRTPGAAYGALIGAAVSPRLLPFIRGGVDDSPTDGGCIELNRLAGAGNQAAGWFRHVHSGTES